MAAEDDAQAFGLQRESTQVKQLVVQRAERQAVGLHIGPASGVPLNVRCLQPSRHIANAKVKPANAAAVLVGLLMPKGVKMRAFTFYS